jgi:hypothetical protein
LMGFRNRAGDPSGKACTGRERFAPHAKLSFGESPLPANF